MHSQTLTVKVALNTLLMDFYGLTLYIQAANASFPCGAPQELWGSLVLQKQSSSNQKGQCSFIILPRGGILKRTNRKGILGQKIHVRDIFQKQAAWEASVPRQTANLYYFLLIIWVQVPVRSQDLLVSWGLSSKVEHFPTNTLIIAGTFSRHQISLVSANVIV